MIRDKAWSIVVGTALCSMLIAFQANGGAFGTNKGASLKASSCSALLPNPLLQEVEKRYRGWKIVDVGDLSSDDQVLWNQTWGTKRCPGVAIGEFLAKGETSYGIALIRREGNADTVAEKLIHAQQKGNSYSMTELVSENNVPVGVVQKGEPGRYAYVYDRNKNVNVKTDTILYIHLEASAIAFFFEAGKFSEVLISD